MNLKLLLHMCCAPCAVYPISVLQDEGAIVHGLFYNPNIHPVDEYKKRRETVEEYSAIKSLPVDYVEGYMQDEWERFGGSDGQRCNMCYSLRLDRAAAYAREKGFDAYTTSLLVSPYQKHDLIRELGERFGKKHGVEFYYRDFRPGFRKGQQQARDMGLYRQKFCGCIISYKERSKA